MTLKDAMYTRHTVRKYTKEPLSNEIVDTLNQRISTNNSKYHISMKLMVNDDRAMTALMKMTSGKTVKNYIILAGKDNPDLDEHLGYGGADIMLFAQSIGLNTWWIGATYNKKALSEIMEGQTVIGIIAVGYGENQGVQHRSKSMDAVSQYEGTTPPWFTQGVEAALLAPTARNKQAFFITGQDNKVEITCDNGVYTGADLGIVKYHFELGAGSNHFEWVKVVH